MIKYSRYVYKLIELIRNSEKVDIVLEHDVDKVIEELLRDECSCCEYFN